MKDATKYIRAKIITALNGNVSYDDFPSFYASCLERFDEMKIHRSMSFLQNGLICLKKKGTETKYQKRYLFFNKNIGRLCLCKFEGKLEKALSTLGISSPFTGSSANKRDNSIFNFVQNTRCHIYYLFY